MVRHHGDFSKIERIRFFIFVVIILLIISAGFFIYQYFIVSKENSYIIKNKYYGFELKTPKNWLAEKNMFYSEDDINQLLEQCNSDKSGEASVYQVGAFKFKDQKYPQNLGVSGYFPPGLSSGAILEIAVDCIPDGIKDRVVDYSYASLKTGGEKTFEAYLNLPDFGKVKFLSLFHNNLRYKINEYVYVAPADKGKNEDKLRQNYTETFNKIISSFKFDD